MKKYVVGIDFSKETMNYCCLLGSADNVVAEGVVSNSKDGSREMVRNLRRLKSGLRNGDFLFCGENTGIYSLCAADYLHSKGYTVWLESPLQIKYSSGMRREKTDAADARMIAEYATRHQDKVKCYNPCPESVSKLNALLKTHEALTDTKRRFKCLMGSLKEIPCTLKKALDEICAQLKETDRKIKKMLEEESAFSENAKLAVSVPGISSIVAAAILIDTRNFTRFDNARSYASHAGCVPCKYESGSSVYRSPRVNKMSNRHINALLTQGALSLMTHNPKIRAYVAKKKEEGKHIACIANNVKNKIIHLLFAVIRKRTPYDNAYKHQTYSAYALYV